MINVYAPNVINLTTMMSQALALLRGGGHDPM